MSKRIIRIPKTQEQLKRIKRRMDAIRSGKYYKLKPKRKK